MNLITIIVFSAGVFLGWKAGLNKVAVKKWIQDRLKKANETTKNL